MTQIERATFELQMKEQRVAYWEITHKLPGYKEIIDYSDNDLATI